jgi:hypothetical protein
VSNREEVRARPSLSFHRGLSAREPLALGSPCRERVDCAPSKSTKWPWKEIFLFENVLAKKFLKFFNHGAISPILEISMSKVIVWVKHLLTYQTQR